MCYKQIYLLNQRETGKDSLLLSVFTGEMKTDLRCNKSGEMKIKRRISHYHLKKGAAH